MTEDGAKRTGGLVGPIARAGELIGRAGGRAGQLIARSWPAQ